MSSTEQSENHLAKAVLLMIVGMMLIPLGDSFAKLVSHETDYPPATIAWARFALGAVLIAPIAFLFGQLRGLTRRFWITQLIRACFLCGAIVLIITAVSLVPFADAYGAFFIGPALTTVFACFILGETVRPIEWFSVVAGFVGVLLIVKPGISMTVDVLWAVGAGCCYAGYLTTTRWGRIAGPPLAQLAGQLLIGALLLLPFALGNMSLLDLQAPGFLLGSGISSAAGNLLAIIALGYARAATLTPLVYTQLIGATLLGLFLFGTVPGAVSALGLSIIVATGIFPFAFRKR